MQEKSRSTFDSDLEETPSSPWLLKFALTRCVYVCVRWRVVSFSCIYGMYELVNACMRFEAWTVVIYLPYDKPLRYHYYHLTLGCGNSFASGYFCSSSYIKHHRTYYHYSPLLPLQLQLPVPPLFLSYYHTTTKIIFKKLLISIHIFFSHRLYKMRWLQIKPP